MVIVVYMNKKKKQGNFREMDRRFGKKNKIWRY